MTLTKKQLQKVQELLLDLDWETDRMSNDGVMTFEKLCDIFKVNDNNFR